MIDIKEEILFDFGVNSSRTVVTDKLAILDNIKRIVDFSDTVVVAQTGNDFFTVVQGSGITIVSFQNSRIVCSGSIAAVEFHRGRNGAE